MLKWGIRQGGRVRDIKGGRQREGGGRWEVRVGVRETGRKGEEGGREQRRFRGTVSPFVVG